MKKFKYTALVMFALIFSYAVTSCMDEDWNDPTGDTAPYGNSELKETNVITIAELKAIYNTVLTTDYRDGVSYQMIDKETQIKAYVTGNDISGNIYNEVALQDETGAIIVAVAQGGIYSYLPVGTEILVELKDLYIGNYRMQPEIGVPYNNGTYTYVSRMSRFIWQKHFKITGNKKVIEPELFADGSSSTTWDLNDDAGKLGVIKNVSIKNGSYYDSDKKTPVNLTFNKNSKFADPDINYSVSWFFNEQPTSIMIYNSPYSDFAARILPQGKCNITGILKRYDNKWEFIIRDENDIEELN